MEVALNNPESLPKDNFADYTDHKDIKVNKYFYYKKKPNFISKMINKKNKFIIKKIQLKNNNKISKINYCFFY